MAEKKYLIDNPELMAEWHWDKNIELDPNTITVGSGKKAWWKCNKGHEWETTIYNRSKGSGCPYCAGQRAIKGHNDLLTVNPILAKEWNYEKNNGLTPMDVMPNSGKKVWWKCNKGHEWQATVDKRSNGIGCPYCAGQKVIKGNNDLLTVNPILAKEWNYERNNELSPEDVMPNSNKKVWWKCSKGHEWQAKINNRRNGRGCPYCLGRFAIKGENDLLTVNPSLAKEWNYEKNGILVPEDMLPNSDKKVWWKCNKGHEWQATIGSRSNGNGCPFCNSEQKTSFPEYAIMYYLKKYNLDVLHSYKDKGYELDIYIPSKNIAIEYDGSFWHKNKSEKDIAKNQKCKKDGITLYRIREGLPSLNDSSIDFIVQTTQKNLSIVLKKVLVEIVGCAVDVDIERDSIDIENLREYMEKENSLLFSNPQIANEWNYEKNGKLRPEHFTANSGKKVWWRCNKGHQWQATIANRNKDSGCPFCSGRYAIKGKNDLKTANPALAKEWNYKKNGDLSPECFTANSSKKVWWTCEKSHEWQAVISHRNKGSGCPYCAGQKVLKGYNDLHTVNPTLAKEWNYEKNGDLKPEHFTTNSGKKVFWKCNKGHEWQATIANRNNGTGCPQCAKEKRKKGK